MPINLPDQQSVSLGGSSISSRDTFSMPGIDQGAQRNADALARSLEQFGAAIGNYGEQEARQKKERQQQAIEGYVSQVRASVGSGTVTEAQVGALQPDLVPSVRALVTEEVGRQNAAQWVSSEYEKLMQDPEVRLDPNKAEAAFAAWNAEAAKQGENNPFFGTGYAKAVTAQIAQARQQFQAERGQYYGQKQEEGYVNDFFNSVKTATSTTPQSKAITGSDVATRITNADPTSVNTPAKLAKVFLGQGEAAGSGALNSFIKRFAGANIDIKDTPWCAAFVDAVLGASGNKRLGSIRAADFARYGNPTNTPQEGDIVVLKPQVRGASGHVGFFAGYDDKGRVLVLGGNQGNKVSVSPFKASDVVSFRDVPKAGVVREKLTTGGSVDDFLALTGDDSKRKTAEDASEYFIKTGVKVTNANLALADIYGPEAATRMIKASPSALIRDVAPEVIKNTGTTNLTVAQVMADASKKVGVPVDPETEAHNAVRTVDQNWGETSSLSNVARRNAVMKAAIARSKAEADDKWLNALPPEWTSIPAVQAEVNAAREEVSREKIRRYRENIALQKEQKEQTRDGLMSQMLTELSKGGRLNPFDERWFIDGKPDPEIVAYAQRQNTQDIADPVSSSNTASEIVSGLNAYGSGGGIGALQQMYPGLTGKGNIEKELRSRIMDDTRLNPSERVKLLDNLATYISGSAITTNPVIKQAFNDGVGSTLDAYLKTPMGQVVLMKNPNIARQVQQAFTNRAQALATAWYQANPGKTMTTADQLDIADRAEEYANKISQGLIASAGKGGDGAPQAPMQAAPKVGEVRNGYTYQGGNPADPNSWRKN